MNKTLSDILDKIQECNSLLDQGIIEDAVLLSGETLARAYEQWSSNFNKNISTTDEINIMAIAASCHCTSLAMIGNYNDAYATAIGAILQISIDPNSSINIDQSLLSIYTTAIMTLLNIVSSLPPDDTSRDHIAIITRYIASMLYYYYNKIGFECPQSPYLDNAYDALSHIRQFTEIETPTITVIDKQISPEYPHELIGDLVGRSQALSLLTD